MNKRLFQILFNLFAVTIFLPWAAFGQSEAVYQQIAATRENVAKSNNDSSPASFGDWQRVGPNGGDIRAIAVDPTNSNHFYFTTLEGQFYTSTDGAASWQMVYNFDRSLLMFDNIIIDKRDPKTIYLGGHRGSLKNEGGFFKSTDGGQTWRESKEMKNQAINALFQSTLNPDMIVAGTVEGVFASTDSGNNWKKISDEKAMPGLVEVDSLAIDPRNTDVIYAGTTYRPYKTTDGGKNWRLISTGMIDDSDVFAVDLDPRDPDHIIASACSGIYESRNAGENWKKIQGIPSTSRRTRDILQHPSKPGYIFAGTTEGFWMSADGGATWNLTTSKQVEVNSISVPADQPNKVYLGTNNFGVMVSNDFGKSFVPTNNGYSTRQTSIIVPDSQIPNRFYAATTNTTTGGGFFYVSNDAGATWQASMRNFPPTSIVYSILQDDKTPTTIYLGTINGIYRSLDSGASWAAVTGQKPKVAPRRTPPRRAAVAPVKRGNTTVVANAKKPAPVVAKKTSTKKTPVATTAKKSTTTVANSAVLKPFVKISTLTGKVNSLISTADGKNGMWAATDTGLLRTYNISTGWEQIPFPENLNAQVLTISVSPSNPQAIWAGTAKSGVLFSRDGGTTWERVESIPTNYPISHIEADPKDANRVYVGTKQTFFLTRDAGQKWERRGGGLSGGDYNSIVINPNNSDEIFAASAQENRDGLFHSVDGGKHWERVDSSSLNLPSRRIWALSFDPRNPNLLLVGSHSSGIYRVERNLSAAIN